MSPGSKQPFPPSHFNSCDHCFTYLLSILSISFLHLTTSCRVSSYVPTGSTLNTSLHVWLHNASSRVSVRVILFAANYFMVSINFIRDAFQM